MGLRERAQERLRKAREPEVREWIFVQKFVFRGQTITRIRCPFCKQEVNAYLWSLAGGGKKCLCGAKHSYFGTTTRKPKI